MLGLPFLDSWFRQIKPSLYDDFVDRVNYLGTSLLLLFFTILVSAKQYVGSPIQCWFPAQFKGGWEEWAEDYCFIQNTYFIPPEHEIPKDIEQRQERLLGYYQWVPIVLAIQAMLFYAPHFVWTALNWQSGINLSSIMQIATKATCADSDERDKQISLLSKYIEDSIGIERDMHRNKIWRRVFGCGRNSPGSYVTCLYLFVKCLYVANVIGQFFLLNGFLGTSYSFWGIQILSDLANGREWQDSGHFPRVTVCDFFERTVGNIHRHSVQCVLMINMFNEKIYLFLWFWFFFVALITIFNLIYWLFISIPLDMRSKFIYKFLRVRSSDEMHGERVWIRRFVASGLRPDGVLCIRFISSHLGDLVALELTYNLWKGYISRRVQDIPMSGRSKVSETSSFCGDHSGSGASGGGAGGEKNADSGLVESLYPAQEKNKDVLKEPLLPSAPMAMENGCRTGYPGPPALPPKPNL